MHLGKTRYLNFSSIRYAAPPLGALRFTAPEPPINNRSADIQDGYFGPPCSQAVPTWFTAGLGSASSATTDVGSEDCLFLDVIVSNETFGYQSNQDRLAPVIVWIHGGGFVFVRRAFYTISEFCLSRIK